MAAEAAEEMPRLDEAHDGATNGDATDAQAEAPPADASTKKRRLDEDDDAEEDPADGPMKKRAAVVGEAPGEVSCGESCFACVEHNNLVKAEPWAHAAQR
jgi:hypothetical protein